MIIHRTNTKWWFHFPCYWNVWVFSFLFWFIFYHLCIDHYCASSTFFFSPLDVCFILSTMHVHSPITCTSHNNSSMSYCTWSEFFIYSHIIINAPPSLTNLWQTITLSFKVFFVIVDCHFITMGPICLRLLPYFWSLLAFVFSLACVYMCFPSPYTFDEWVSILDLYIYKIFLLFCVYKVRPCMLVFGFFLNFFLVFV